MLISSYRLISCFTFSSALINPMSKGLLCPAFRYFHRSAHLDDWIRRNTPRKPTVYKIPRPLTVLEEEMIDLPTLEERINEEDKMLVKDVITAVNSEIANNQSRYFAVIHLAGKEFKVTTEDLVMVKTPLFGTDIGDRIRLEKVLLLGSRSFSLIGRPLLNNRQVWVEAQVIEKTLEHPKLWFQFHRRRRHRKMRVFQDNVVVLRITDIRVNPLDADF